MSPLLILYKEEGEEEKEQKGRAERENGNVPSAGSLPNGKKGQSWTSQKPEAWKHMQASHVDTGAQVFDPTSTAFPELPVPTWGARIAEGGSSHHIPMLASLLSFLPSRHFRVCPSTSQAASFAWNATSLCTAPSLTPHPVLSQNPFPMFLV